MYIHPNKTNKQAGEQTTENDVILMVLLTQYAGRNEISIKRPTIATATANPTRPPTNRNKNDRQRPLKL